MKSSTAVTRRRLQPIALPTSPGDRRQLRLADGQVVAQYLNASQGSRSHARILELRGQMVDLHEGLSRWNRLHEELQSRVSARAPEGDKALAKRAAEYSAEADRLGQLLETINRTLAGYRFHPIITYTAITDTRSEGFTPVPRGYELRIEEWSLSEPDAAAALVRLYQMKDLWRVRLCDQCKKRWLVAAKSHYHFCSKQCREENFVHSPAYAARRREIQKGYRERKKRAEHNKANLR